MRRTIKFSVKFSGKTKRNVAREYFLDELKSALQRNRVNPQHECIEYVADIMVRHLQSEDFFAKGQEGELKNNVLADLYAEYLNGTADSRKVSLRRLGDICLLISGFFSDSLNRKLVDIDYYLGMGGSAYSTLSHMNAAPVKMLYQEMADKIKPFSNALGEISEQTGVQSNTDLLRVYERWLHTGSERLRALLTQNGITITAHRQTKERH